MGFSSDIMHDFVAKEIRNIYSSYDGWKISYHPLGNGYDTIVSMERLHGGHRDSVKIFVTFNRSVPVPLPEELTRPDQAADGTITRHEYAVMAPSHADTSAVPAGICIYSMRSFAFENKELIWVKKPVRSSVCAPAELPA